MQVVTEDIELSQRETLLSRFKDKFEVDYKLTRKIVSFQANKTEPLYRLFKYKEGFSVSLVKYFLAKYSEGTGHVLDPFAGVGTTLFAAQESGWDSTGIELLPVGNNIIKVRNSLHNINLEDFKSHAADVLANYRSHQPLSNHINHVSITQGAFPTENEQLLNCFIDYVQNIVDPEIKELLRFAAFSILEEISYTRKDGQYLRWDSRSNRQNGSKDFSKGIIHDFSTLINKKIKEIIADIQQTKKHDHELFETVKLDHIPSLNVVAGSCLHKMLEFANDSFDFIITSPPYCNRYDYTRTYALELVFLGVNDTELKNYRQDMMSCTVENKEKSEQLFNLYGSHKKGNDYETIMTAIDQSLAFQEVNNVLDALNKQDKLNNKNIARMVKNYITEFAFVIYEMARVLRSGGRCVVVNDNVRYGGEEVPLDIIFSELAERFGLTTEKIFVLGKGKGNSSQQMGEYGRTEIRKCVYLWHKL